MFRSLFNFLFGKKRQQPDFIAPELHSIPVELEESVFAAGEPLYGSVYPHDWERIRREVLNRDGGHCQVTGCLNYYRSPSDFYGDLSLDVHHKTPISEGGSHELKNLITLCVFHHGLIHHKNLLSREKIPNKRFSLIRPYWRRTRWSSERHHVKASVRRFRYVTKEELRQVRDFFGLVCKVKGCGSDKWQGDYFAIWKGFTKLWFFETRCLNCGERWLFNPGLLEETGFQIAYSFKATKNQGAFHFDPNLIVGLNAPQHFEGCPICRFGYLVKRIRRDNGDEFLGCSEWRHGQGCNYTRPIKK